MVILASEEKEIGVVKDVVFTADANGENRIFSMQIARCNWNKDMYFSHYVYVPDTEFGGRIGEVLTDTTLDYVEVKGYTWRGMLGNKVIVPPTGSNHRIVSGELHDVLKELIEPEFGGLFVVSSADTGATVSGFKFERYCTLLDGIVKMLSEVGYRLKLSRKRVKDGLDHVLVEAIPIVDYSRNIELSKDFRLNYMLDDKRDGVNHLIVTGKGELQERNVFHLYAWPDGSIKKTPYYTGINEIVKVYENTSTETDELQAHAEKELKELMNKKIFKMSAAELRDEVGIGDIVGSRDYLTGLYAAKPIENIIYTEINGVEAKQYKLEGEDQDE